MDLFKSTKPGFLNIEPAEIDDSFSDMPQDFIDKIIEQKNLERTEKFLYRFYTGKIKFKEYKKLSKKDQDWYKQKFGRPKTDNELKAITKQRAKAKIRQKIAAQSRKRNK